MVCVKNNPLYTPADNTCMPNRLRECSKNEKWTSGQRKAAWV